MLPNDVSDIKNMNVSHATANITHDTIEESSENGDDSENNVGEDMQETEDLWETLKMMAGTNYAYNINIREMRSTFANSQEATDICNAIKHICKLKGFIKQRVDHSANNV